METLLPKTGSLWEIAALRGASAGTVVIISLSEDINILVFYLLSNIEINAARAHFYDVGIYPQGAGLVRDGLVA
jgi:hypothetical protein